jgi:hypothetical protein
MNRGCLCTAEAQETVKHVPRIGIVDRTGVNWKAFKLFVCSVIAALNIAPRPEAKSKDSLRPYKHEAPAKLSYDLCPTIDSVPISSSRLLELYDDLHITVGYFFNSVRPMIIRSIQTILCFDAFLQWGIGSSLCITRTHVYGLDHNM